MWYANGAFRNRYKQVAVTPTGTETTIYVAGLLEKVTRGSLIEYRHAIHGGKGVAAIHTRRAGSQTNADTVYLHRDQLGSPELITDSAGLEIVRPSFGADGERRDGTDWSGPPSTADLTDIANTIRRGFTGHEHLDAVGLIHMNGRVYEPVAGRFLSADPIVHVGLSQSPNRYSYVWNNPLTLIDPSGLDPPPPDGSGACNPQCPDVPVTGPRPRRPRFPAPGGGSGQVESASQRDPCGQDSSQMACDEAEGLLSEFLGGESQEQTQPERPQEEQPDACRQGSAERNVVRAPDYWELQINIAIPTPWTGTLLGVSGHISLDRNGEWYGGIGPGVGRSATVVSGSLIGNWMLQTSTSTGSELQNFLTGHAFNAGGGYWGGLNVTYSPTTDQNAVGVGVVSPQVGGGYQYSWDIGENTHGCP